MLQLRSYTKFPPEGFWYRDENPPGRTFPAEGGMRHVVSRLYEYRTANSFPNSTWEACWRDVENFTMARLNNDPKWVQDTDIQQYVAPVRSKSGGCCGAKVA